MRVPLLSVTCLAIALCACQPSAPAPTPAAAAPVAAKDDGGPPTNADAPPAEIPALKIATVDGGTYDLAARRGRWVVVNFWATWCAPCLKEMPELDAFDVEREDVEVLGLAYEEIAVDEMRAFLAKRPVKYPIAIVDTYNPPQDFATPRGLPTTYVIAPDGKVAKEFMGPITRSDLSAVIGGAPAANAAAGDKAAGSG